LSLQNNQSRNTMAEIEKGGKKPGAVGRKSPALVYLREQGWYQKGFQHAPTDYSYAFNNTRRGGATQKSEKRNGRGGKDFKKAGSLSTGSKEKLQHGGKFC